MAKNTNHKKKIVLICILVVSLLGSIYLLTRKNTNSDDTLKIYDNVYVLTEETEEDHIPVLVTDNTLVYSEKPSYVQGDVVVAGIIDSAPTGFIRKVVNISYDEDYYYVETEPACLTDVFEEAHITKRFILSENGVEEQTIVQSEVEKYGKNTLCAYATLDSWSNVISQRGLLVALMDNETEYQFAREFEYDLVKDVSVHGGVGFNISLEVNIDIKHGNVEFDVIAHQESGGEIFVGCAMDQNIDFEKELLSQKLPNVQFFIGFIPIVITNEIQVNLEGELSVEGEIGYNFEIKTDNTLGFQYSSKTGEINEVRENQYMADGMEWETEATVVSDNSIGVMMHLITKLYDSTGADISIGIEGNIKGEVGIDENEEKNTYEYVGNVDLAIQPLIQGRIVVSIPIVDKKLAEKPIFEVILPAFWEMHWDSGDNWKEELEELENQQIRETEWYQLYSQIIQMAMLHLKDGGYGYAATYYAEGAERMGDGVGGVAGDWNGPFSDIFFYLKDISVPQDDIPELFIGIEVDGEIIINVVYTYGDDMAYCLGDSSRWPSWPLDGTYDESFVYLCTNNALYQTHYWGGEFYRVFPSGEEVAGTEEMIIDSNTLEWNALTEW